MKLDQPNHIAFLVGFVVFTGIRHVYQSRTRNVETAEKRLDGRELSLLAVVSIGMMILPLLYLFSAQLAVADVTFPPFVPWCGFAVMVFSLVLFWRSHADLGLFWSVTLEIRKEHRLIDSGVYRSVRHPMYTSIWLWSLAQGLMLENWIAGPSALVTFAPLYFIRTPREERMMVEVLGDEYREYMGRTGRLLPRMQRPRSS